MIISTNVPALKTYASMSRANKLVSQSSPRLSSGKKLINASDNPAGSAIAKKLQNQTEGTKIASDNSSNGIALIQTAEGALTEVQNMITRIRELSVQAATETLDNDDRAKIQNEVNQLYDEINAISNKTEYNQMKLLNGEASDMYVGKLDASLPAITDPRRGIVLQVGANQHMEFQVIIPSMKADVVFGGSDMNLSTDANGLSAREHAGNLIELCDQATSYVSIARAQLGAYQNRLEFTVLSLDNSSEQMERSLSRIVDVDMAAEMIEYSKNNVILQAGMSIMAQANQRPQSVLQLLGR